MSESTQNHESGQLPVQQDPTRNYESHSLVQLLARRVANDLVDGLIDPEKNLQRDQTELYVCLALLSSLNQRAIILALEEMLADADERKRLGAGYLLLCELGEASEAATKVYADILSGQPSELRSMAIVLSSFANHVPEGIIPAFKQLLENEEQLFRVYAAVALRDADPLASVRVLVPAMDNANATLAAVAAGGLVRSKAGIRKKEAMAKLLAALKTDPDMRESILKWLMGVDYSSDDLEAELRSVLSDPNLDDVSRAVVQLILGNIGKSKETEAALTQSLKAANFLDVYAAGAGLHSFQRRGEKRMSADAVPMLTGLLEAREEPLRCAAATALAEFGTEAKEAVPVLIERLKTECEPLVTLALLRALVSVGSPAVPALIREVIEMDAVSLPLARTALERIGTDAAPAVAQSLMGHQDPSVRMCGGDILRMMGGRAVAAVPDLLRLLEEKDDGVRLDIVMTLGMIGPAASAAAPALITFLLAGTPFLKKAAGTALRRIGPDTKSQLQAALAGADAASRQQLSEILSQFGGEEAPSTWFEYLDRSLLEFLVILGDEPTKKVSVRGMARRFAGDPHINPDFPNSASGVRRWVRKLENACTRHEGRAIRLLTAEAGEEGRLSSYADALIIRVRSFLEQSPRRNEMT